MRKRISTYTLLLGVLVIIAISCRKDEKSPDPVTDIEGNIYKTVKIGTQVWIAENLKTTKYNDGTDISLITDSTNWRNLSTPGFCWYNNDEASYKDPFGAIYNGYAVSNGQLCPVGWHVPEREEWKTLWEFLGDSISGGGKLKEAGTVHWRTPNKGADNSSGFTALAAGIRYFEGTFSSVLCYTSIWTATETGTNDQWYVGLYYGDASVIMDHRSKKYGFSVRCIKD